jgi:hypothetical protein
MGEWTDTPWDRRPTVHARAKLRPGVTITVQRRAWANDWCAAVHFVDQKGHEFASCHGASSTNRNQAIRNAIRGARMRTRTMYGGHR